MATTMPQTTPAAAVHALPTTTLVTAMQYRCKAKQRGRRLQPSCAMSRRKKSGTHTSTSHLRRRPSRAAAATKPPQFPPRQSEGLVGGRTGGKRCSEAPSLTLQSELSSQKWTCMTDTISLVQLPVSVPLPKHNTAHAHTTARIHGLWSHAGTEPLRVANLLGLAERAETAVVRDTAMRSLVPPMDHVTLVHPVSAAIV